jgi:hypothetical protein
MFVCKPLPTHTTEEDIFNLTDLYMAEKCCSWNQCVDICIDGTQLMVGKVCGFTAHVKATVPECTSSNCIIHCQALIRKKISKALKKVLDEILKIVNFKESTILLMRRMWTGYHGKLLHNTIRVL